MQIIKREVFVCYGKEFNTSDEALDFCEEKIAEHICDFMSDCEVLSPKARLRVLAKVKQMKIKEHQQFASLFLTETFEEE